MRPPAPRVSSSGWGEKTMRRVFCERSASSGCSGFPCAHGASNRAPARRQKRNLFSFFLQPSIVQKLAQHLFSREIFPSDLTRSLTVHRVIAPNLCPPLNHLLKRGKTHDPPSGRQKSTEAGPLYQHWPPGCQITDATVAEPPAPGFDIARFRHAEFATRTLDILVV